MASSAKAVDPRRVRKRLVVFSDGTWQSEQNENPTNIYRLFAMTKRASSDGAQQIAFYDPGIGVVSNLQNQPLFDRLWNIREKIKGGLFGYGIEENIKQLYTFLASNYNTGDEIYLFGYSRGAFTVRSLAGMIAYSGLLQRNQLAKVHDAFEAYRAKKSVSDVLPGARAVNITFIGCFDTVGSLGIPDWFSNWAMRQRYQFHNTKISNIVRHAVHVLSVDEDRKGFEPTQMDKADNVTELFFPGTHGGVGGQDRGQEGLGGNSLQFMIAKVEELGLGLEFDDGPINRHLTGQIVPGGFPFLSEPRKIESVQDCHDSVGERYRLVEEWRPRALDHLKAKLLRGEDGGN